MTIFAKQALIESSPAFNVFSREADRTGFVNITAKMVSDPYAGHKLHWINANGSVLTSRARPAKDVIEVSLGMRVRFEGLLATIEADHNDNLRFAPIAA